MPSKELVIEFCHRAREEIQDKEKFPQNQMKEISDLHRHLSQKESILQDLKKENAALIAKLLDVENKLSSCLNKELVWQKECQQKLQEQQSAFETKLQSELKRVFDQVSLYFHLCMRHW